MVVRINTPHRLLSALNYNEKKVLQNKAACIYAGNYLQKAVEMNFYAKHTRLENQNKLNERATTKTLHISLNFDQKENLSNEKLITISNEYMELIGFADQPFLVYKHNDAGHPHVHIVASAIKANGSRINTHNLGRNQSEKARKEIEIKYHLVKASDHTIKDQFLKPLDVNKIDYGKTETKRNIGNIVTQVMNAYNYTSLAELNAALKQYNIVADRGSEDSVIFKKGGLLYRILDEKNNKIGVPIKASSIFSKPTLKKLEARFELNRSSRLTLKNKLKDIIDMELAKKPSGIRQLIALLTQRQIYTLIRQNEEGRMYGITFVDNVNKSVFNGSDIGKGYSLSSLQKHFTGSIPNTVNNNLENSSANNQKSPAQNESLKKGLPISKLTLENNLLQQLLSSQPGTGNTALSLKRKKKKKKKNTDL